MKCESGGESCEGDMKDHVSGPVRVLLIGGQIEGLI